MKVKTVVWATFLLCCQAVYSDLKSGKQKEKKSFKITTSLPGDNNGQLFIGGHLENVNYA